MKLKQRIWIIGGCIGVLFCVLSFNFMTSQIDNTDDLKVGTGLVNKARELQGIETDSSDSNVISLVHALSALSKNVASRAAVSSGAVKQDEALSYKGIVEKLLQDRTFNSEDTINSFINIGKLLEVNQKSNNHVAHRNISASIDEFQEFSGKPRTSNALTRNNSKSVFPQFNLDARVVPALYKYLETKHSEHNVLRKHVKKGISFRVHHQSKLVTWQKWQNSINQYGLYSGEDGVASQLLVDLGSLPIIGMSTLADYGTQIKLVFKLSDGSQALFKPMRFRRDQERDPNLYYFDDFERHHAEIAAFHLDRVMQFHRVPPNAGRLVNITSIIEHYATKSFKRTIFISPAGNKCFYGKCDYYCDSGHPVCGHGDAPDVVEGAMAAWLPFGQTSGKKGWENPWRRSYSKFRKAEWEKDASYCDKVKKTAPYNSGRRLLDLMDITIFDYLAGNQDRHHYHTFKIFGNYTSPMLYDNGRGFGFIYSDDESILVPVVQCCQIRYSTLRKLLQYESGQNKLSERMRRSLMKDPVSSGPNGPVLSEGHLMALDRRVSKILNAIWNCVKTTNYDDVIKDDGF